MVDNNSKFSWKTERNSSYKILAIEGIPNFGEDLDAMLINQAKCVVGFTSSDNSFKKLLRLVELKHQHQMPQLQHCSRKATRY